MTKRRKTPQEKKADEYTKDHLTLKGAVIRVSSRFRKTWPRKKANANRYYRRQVRHILADAAHDQETAAVDLIPSDAAHLNPVKKWPHSVVSVGTIVESRNERRSLRGLKSFIWYTYNCDRDKTRFSAFLASQVGGRTKNSRLLALYFDQLMNPSNEGRWADEWLSEKGQQWLRAFFRDEPEWEERVRAWIASFDE